MVCVDVVTTIAKALRIMHISVMTVLMHVSVMTVLMHVSVMSVPAVPANVILTTDNEDLSLGLISLHLNSMFFSVLNDMSSIDNFRLCRSNDAFLAAVVYSSRIHPTFKGDIRLGPLNHTVLTAHLSEIGSIRAYIRNVGLIG